MRERHHLAWPFYLTGLAVVVFPAVEFILTVWPLSPGVLSWRFGAVGLLSRSIMTPLVGVVLILATATLLEHRWVQRGVMAGGFVGGAVLLATVGLFVLDLIQFREQVRAGAQAAYDVASAMVVLKLLTGSVVLGAFGVSGLALARHAGLRGAHHTGAPMIVSSRRLEDADPAARARATSGQGTEHLAPDPPNHDTGTR